MFVVLYSNDRFDIGDLLDYLLDGRNLFRIGHAFGRWAFY
jgi:hypothetical protein